MVQGYYTLEEAARILGITQEKLSQMAQKREIRAFADRGTWRFRTQDIEEMARRMGLGSSPELQLGEAPPPSSKMGRKSVLKPGEPGPRKSVLKPGESPRKSGLKTGDTPPAQAAPSEGDVFDFELNAGEPEGGDIVIDSPSTTRKSSGKLGSPSPRPKPGSDSDVQLVPDGSDVDFKINVESDPKLQPGSASSARRKSGLAPGAGAPASSTRKKTGMTSGAGSSGKLPRSEEEISPGELAPRRPEDSDIRLDLDEGPAKGPRSANSQQPTEEIDLDAEMRKAEAAASARQPRSKVKPKTRASRPAPSPDETAAYDEEDVSLGELSPLDVAGAGGQSGINLHAPADSGINLEQEQPADTGDKIEFELSLDDAGGAAPGSGSAPHHAAGSSEFELSLEGEELGGSPAAPAGGDDSSSEFELSLDTDDAPKSAPRSSPAVGGDDSSSEFELTLDDGGGLVPEEPAAEGGEEADKDIFETDFEVPALDESGSEGAALDESDTALESSDFDLSVSEEESGSQVVALDEEAEEGAATIAGEGPGDEEAADEVDELLSEDMGETEAEADEDEDADSRRAAPAAAAAPASWGVFPALMLLPCVLVMFLLGLMAFELVHGMWGYKQPYQPTGMISKFFAETFGEKVPE